MFPFWPKRQNIDNVWMSVVNDVDWKLAGILKQTINHCDDYKYYDNKINWLIMLRGIYIVHRLLPVDRDISFFSKYKARVD